MRQAIKEMLEETLNNTANRKWYNGLCSRCNQRALYQCDASTAQLKTLADWLDENFKSWPEFSGNDDYPVPSPNDGLLSHNDAYDVLDLYDGEYGASRLRLAAHLLANVGSLPE